MHRTGWVGPALWLFLLGLALLAHPAHAQMEDECANRDWGGSDREHACVVREMRMPASGSLEVDGGLNGGVQVEGTAPRCSCGRASRRGPTREPKPRTS
jgi:hypothetical protein